MRQPNDQLFNEFNHEKERFWEEHLKRKEEMGLSGSAYCRKFKLSYRQFSYWGQKSQEDTISQLTPVHIEAPPQSSIHQNQGILCTLMLKKGHELRIHDQALVPMLLSLLS